MNSTLGGTPDADRNSAKCPSGCSQGINNRAHGHYGVVVILFNQENKRSNIFIYNKLDRLV